MKSNKVKNNSKTAKIGWILLIIFSVLMIIAGLGWVFALPEMLLENIAEMAELDPEQFRIGDPSASDLIAMIAQGYGFGYTAVGFASLFLALEGYKNGTRSAWRILWILTIAYAALAFTFLQAGENATLSIGVLSFALISFIGQILARQRFS